MIDRQARQKLADIIRSYLNEEITAHPFVHAINELEEQTKDMTVCQVVRLLWYFYDDYKDHKVVATKESWDCLQRILLLLESDGELGITRVRHWSPRQPFAGCALAVFAFIAFRGGWGHYLAMSVLFGIVSMLLSAWRLMPDFPLSRKEIPLYPFASRSELLSVRRRVASFSKTPYPAARLQSREIREPGEKLPWWVPSGLCGKVLLATHWLLFAPVVLLFQAMPDTEEKMRVILSEQDAPAEAKRPRAELRCQEAEE